MRHLRQFRSSSVCILVVCAPALLCLSGCARLSTLGFGPKNPAFATTKPTRQLTNAADAGDGDYEARTLRAKLDANPTDLATRLELARHYQQAGFPEVAIEHCRLACERAPESAEAHIALARMLRENHRGAEALAELKNFSAARPDSAPGAVTVWAWLGLLSDDAGDWKSGEAAYRRAVALAPARDDLRNNLGYCLLKQGRSADAAAEFREALRLNSSSVIARNNLGLATADNPKEAVQNWQAIGDPASAHNNLAVTLIEAGKYDDARREVQTALSYDRESSAALTNLRLLSQLDGKASEIPAGGKGKATAQRAGAATTRFHWWQFWKNDNSPVADDPGIKPNFSKPDNPIASR